MVTIVTPQIDAERLSDILLLMLKNRGAGFMARLYIQVSLQPPVTSKSATGYNQLPARANQAWSLNVPVYHTYSHFRSHYRTFRVIYSQAKH